MIEGLRPYTDMVATGLPWLPAVPAHWEVRRSKYLAREVDKRSVTGEETHLSMNQRLGLVPSSESTQRRLVSESYVGGKLVATNDLVLNRLKAHLGVFAYASQPGVISPDYSVFRPEPSVDVRYLEFVLKSPACRGELRTRTKGIVEGFWRLYTDDFYDIRLPHPPLEEQRLIVRFLDWHGGMTARLIRTQQGILKLVAERREAVTQEALNATDTEYYRFGRVAEKLFREVDRGAASDFVTVGLFNRGRGIFHKAALSGADLGESTFSWIEAGDLIFSGQFAWEGAVALANERDAGRIASHRYHIVRGNPKIVDNTYLWCLFRSSYGEMLLNEHSRGAAGRNRPLNSNYLMKEIIPVPSLREQRRMKEMVDLERQIAQRVADLVRRLQEFRTRLIADVVTGQFDVRVLAATLPAETAAVSLDDLIHGDEADEDADTHEAEEADA